MILQDPQDSKTFLDQLCRLPASQEFYFIEFTRTGRVLFLETLIRPSPQLLRHLATTCIFRWVPPTTSVISDETPSVRRNPQTVQVRE
jgi:hypothetical protein